MTDDDPAATAAPTVDLASVMLCRGDVRVELDWDRSVPGRVSADGAVATWVDGPFVGTAEVSELPDGIADRKTCLQVLTAVVEATPGFRPVGVHVQRLDGAEVLVLRAAAVLGAGDTLGADRLLLAAACRADPTLATLRVGWTETAPEREDHLPAALDVLRRWKVRTP